VFLETQGSTWETFYLYFAGALHAQYKNGLTSFIHRDHLGSTRLVTALNQSVSDNLDYLPFGEQILGDTTTTHKFTGKERDSESSLDNFGARYNSSNIGRFMSPDPSPMGIAMADPQSWNLYSYVRNRPTRSIDVGGNWATDVHAQMVTFALQAYVSAGELAQLVHRQYVMDSDQSPVHQYMHAMSNGDDPNDTPQVAAEHMWKFIAISIGASNATLTPNGNFTSFSLDSLGDAIHTVEDYTSPMHTSGGMPLPWNGGYWPPTKWGPGLNHVMGEDSPTRDWAALGFAVRLTMAVFLQSGASCENGKRCLTEANFESEARKNIEDFVQSFYFSDGGNWSGREAAADAARQCALGNPAACIK
jgi:RHS repeat-associated protein